VSSRADDFNRANGTLSGATPSDGGSAWTVSFGTFAVDTNKAKETSGAAHCNADLEASETDGTVQVTLSTLGSADIGLVFRKVDANNFWFVYENTSGVVLKKMVAGSPSTVAFALPTTADGDVLSVVLSGDTITVKRNGSNALSPATVTDATHNTGTRHGLYVSLGGGSERADDFGFTGTSPPPATSYTFTGPSSGLVNTASTNFTVTPNGPATETVTPATDGAGSFTPSSVTFDGTAAAKTFTYTPTSTAGTPHTLSVTDGGSLTDPAPLDYAVTSGTIACSLADDTWGRAGTGNWSPTVSGTYTGSPTTIRGRKRLEGGSYGGYFAIDAAPAGGTWTGPVDFPASDVDYELEVSFGNDTAVTDTVTGLGAVKKVVGVVDQSNGAGTGTNNQTARTTPGCSAHKMLKGSTYSDLGDPTQAGSTGSKILHFVNVLGALLGIRFGLVNTAVGGNGITTWGSGGSNYIAAKAAFTTVGGVDVICGFPRESDAAAGTTQAAYEAAGQALIDDLLADFPTIELFVLDDLQTVDTAGGATAPRQAAIRAAIDALVAANSDVAVKAPVQAVPAYPGNDYHWLTDQQLAEVGGLGAAAAYRVLDPAGGGGGSAVFNPLGAGIVRGL
jgi:hypothetical protein